MQVVIKWDYDDSRPSQPWYYSVTFFKKKQQGYAASMSDVWRIIDIFIAEQVVHS